jgi:hypothetical protein
MRGITQVLSAIAVLAGARAASACPSCPSVRLTGDLVCGDHLWTNLMTAAPFALFAALSWALSRAR